MPMPHHEFPPGDGDLIAGSGGRSPSLRPIDAIRTGDGGATSRPGGQILGPGLKLSADFFLLAQSWVGCREAAPRIIYCDSFYGQLETICRIQFIIPDHKGLTCQVTPLNFLMWPEIATHK